VRQQASRPRREAIRAVFTIFDDAEASEGRNRHPAIHRGRELSALLYFSGERCG
jgi:hypothetical protein